MVTGSMRGKHRVENVHRIDGGAEKGKHASCDMLHRDRPHLAVGLLMCLNPTTTDRVVLLVIIKYLICMIHNNSTQTENLLSNLGGSNSSDSSSRDSVAANDDGGLSDNSSGPDASPVGRRRDDEKEDRPARQAARQSAIADSEERGRLEEEGRRDGDEDFIVQRVEDFLAEQAAKDDAIMDLYVIPWLLTQSVGFYVEKVGGQSVYCFLDGKENQHYKLTGVPSGYSYQMLDGHKFVCRIIYENGERVLLNDSSEVGKVLEKDWGSSGAQD